MSQSTQKTTGQSASGTENAVEFQTQTAGPASAGAVREKSESQPEQLGFAGLLQELASLLVEILGVDVALVAEVASDGKRLRQAFLVRGTSGQLESLAADQLPQSEGKPMAAYALEKRDIVVSDDLAGEKRFHDPAIEEVKAASGFVVPLFIDRRPFAVLGAFSRSRRSFNMADTLFVKAIGQQLAALARRLQNEHIRRARPNEAPPEEIEQEEQRSSPRRPYPYVQKIAPIYSGLIPSADKFFKVRCRDISAGGISIYLNKPPDFERLVISLGAPPTVYHYTARVVRVELVEENDRNVYLVGCRFTGRVYL